MEFGFDNGPHLKDKDHTAKIMSRLFTALLPIILFAIYKNGLMPFFRGYTDLLGGIKPLLMILLAIFTSVLTEVLYYRFIVKKDNIRNEIANSFAIFPGLFMALTLPINTPLWLVVLGSFVATFIGKLIFGGFGYNIFNPALVGSIFVIASYGALISSLGGYLNPMEVDTVSGATALSNFSNLGHIGTWDSLVKPFGSISSFLLGFIPGSLGETSKLLIIIGFIYLAITKVIKWIIPVSYVSVVFIMTFIIGTINNINIIYPVFHILSGGLLFGAVFMATDPVTSPTTKGGQLLCGISLGILTVIFRFLTPYPEGVLTSILTMNMLVFIFDKIGSKAKFKIKYRYIPLIVLLITMIGISLFIGNDIKDNKVKPDQSFKINNIDTEGSKTIYDVSQKGFHGFITAIITIENDKVTNINITKQEETYWSEIENQDYLNKLINNQSNLNNADTISGATISSNALKSMINKVLKDYEANQ